MRAETLKGHLDGMLLAALEAGPRHGYAVMEALRAGSGGHFDLPAGTVYPALRRLERAGLIHGKLASTPAVTQAAVVRGLLSRRQWARAYHAGMRWT